MQAGGDTWFSTSATVIAPGGGSGTTAIGDTIHAGGAGGAIGTGVGTPGCGGSGGAGGPAAAGSIGGAGGSATTGTVGGGGGGGAANGGGAGTIGVSNGASTASGGAGGGAAGGAGGTQAGPTDGGAGGLASGGGGGLGSVGGAFSGSGGPGGDDYNNGGGGGGANANATSGGNGANGGTPGGGGTNPGGVGVSIGQGGWSLIKLTYPGSDADQIIYGGTITAAGVQANIPAAWGGTYTVGVMNGGFTVLTRGYVNQVVRPQATGASNPRARQFYARPGVRALAGKSGIKRLVPRHNDFTPTVITAQTWSPPHTSAQVALSNNNLTASLSTNPGFDVTTYGLVSQTTGLYYWEIVVTSGTTANAGGGVGNFATNTGGYLGFDISSVGWFGGGGVFTNNVNSATWATFATGNRLCFALDLNNHKIWGRVGTAGNWNNDVIGNQNPATNTGGFALNAAVYAGYGAVPGANVQHSGDQIDASFASTSWSGTAPSGFGPWVAASSSDQNLAPGAGSVVFTGLAPSADEDVQPGAGSVVFTGQAPSTLVEGVAPRLPRQLGRGPKPLIPQPWRSRDFSNISSAPGAGSIAFTGFAPSADESVTPSTGSVVFTGIAPSLTEDVQPGVGSVVFTGKAPSADETVAPSTGSVAFTGFAPSLAEDVQPGAGSVVLTGQAPSTLVEGIAPRLPRQLGRGPKPLIPQPWRSRDFSNISSAPGAGLITFTGFAPSADESVAPSTGSVAFTGFAPSADETVAPGAGSIVFTGKAPSADETVALGAGSIIFTGFAPSADETVAPGAGSIVFTGFAPFALADVAVPRLARQLGRGPRPLIPQPWRSRDFSSSFTANNAAPGVGSVVFTGQTPSADQALQPTTGSVQFTGIAPSVDQALQPGAGSIVFTGFAPSPLLDGVASRLPRQLGRGPRPLIPQPWRSRDFSRAGSNWFIAGEIDGAAAVSSAPIVWMTSGAALAGAGTTSAQANIWALAGSLLAGQGNVTANPMRATYAGAQIDATASFLPGALTLLVTATGEIDGIATFDSRDSLLVALRGEFDGTASAILFSRTGTDFHLAAQLDAFGGFHAGWQRFVESSRLQPVVRTAHLNEFNRSTRLSVKQRGSAVK